MRYITTIIKKNYKNIKKVFVEESSQIGLEIDISITKAVWAINRVELPFLNQSFIIKRSWNKLSINAKLLVN